DVFDSRDPGFADAVRATTGGGVDVVLNSLAGPALRRGIECLAPFGRFVELGKQDIAENRTIALATFAENLSFHALDADRLLAARPAAVGALLARLAADIAAERLPKLPVATFGADEADQAFALMKRAAHIGKIVIRPPTTRRSRAVPAPAKIGQERRPAWIIAGGTGGLGLEIAEALARRRKARVLLVARRAPRAQYRQRIEALQREGLAIETCLLDGADRAALEALARRIESDSETLEGVLHAAMVLHDTPIAQQTPAPVAAVLHAKVAVAEALAGLTAAWPECRLVMLGSASALVGNPNQAAYAAANGALEGIARQCRADGRSAITLALGPVGDAGRLAADPTLRQRLEAHWAGQPGAGFLSAQTVVDAVLNAIADPGIGPVLPLLAAAQPPRASGARHARAGARLAVFGEAAQSTLGIAGSQPATPVGGATEGSDTAGSPIHTLAPAKRHAVIQRRLRDAAAQVLRQPADEIDIDRPLSDIGFDSLMIVDLKLAAEEALHLPLSLDGVGHGESLKSLADRVAAEVAPRDGVPHEEAVALDAGRATSPAPPAGSGSSDDALLSALVERHAVGMPAQARARLVEIVGTSTTESNDQGYDRPMTEAPRHG
ncbi:MAG: SDR family NAD(P)-dependent oxidoreductase, partial [Pseudomonadota bacterium]